MVFASSPCSTTRRGQYPSNDRKGYDFARRFPLAAAAVAVLPVRSCVIDGEAIACAENGLSVFDLLPYWRRDQVYDFVRFDLLDLNGKDLRRQPIAERKRLLARPLRSEHSGIALNRRSGADQHRPPIPRRRSVALSNRLHRLPEPNSH